MSSSNNVLELQNKIIELKIKLSEINKDEKPLPEFINTTNMLRSNEYLQKSNDTKSSLLIAYEEYSNELENLISSISKIKNNIASLKSRMKSRNKPKKPTKKRTIKRKIKSKNRKKLPKKRR